MSTNVECWECYACYLKPKSLILMLCESYVFATLSFMWSVSAMCWNLNIYVYCAYLSHFQVLFLDYNSISSSNNFKLCFFSRSFVVTNPFHNNTNLNSPSIYCGQLWIVLKLLNFTLNEYCCSFMFVVVNGNSNLRFTFLSFQHLWTTAKSLVNHRP